MKTIKNIGCGLILGGGFGSQIGAYLSYTFEFSSSLMVTGLFFGSLTGITVSLAALLLRANVRQSELEELLPIKPVKPVRTMDSLS